MVGCGPRGVRRAQHRRCSSLYPVRSRARSQEAQRFRAATVRDIDEVPWALFGAAQGSALRTMWLELYILDSFHAEPGERARIRPRRSVCCHMFPRMRLDSAVFHVFLGGSNRSHCFYGCGIYPACRLNPATGIVHDYLPD